MKIMKFGGSSVANAQKIRAVVEIIRQARLEGERLVVVCSALGGVTDALIEIARLAQAGDKEYIDRLDALVTRHVQCSNELLSGTSLEDARAHLKDQLGKLEEILRGIFLIQECTDRSLDLVMSFGERLSNYLVCASLKQFEPEAVMLDTRFVIKTNDQFGDARVKMEESFVNIRNHSNADAPVRIVTGFIASTDRGETTTIGRGGSDYTASLFGAALNAQEIQIWTDVDGVLSADPRIVELALPVKTMTYLEAMELSHFGAKVIYPRTMQPALDMGIPIRIKNTFNPKALGTLIANRDQLKANGPVTGISTIKDVAFLRVHGSGMLGVTGTAGRMFSALSRKDVNIIMITQGSSEHSICAAISPDDVERGVRALKEEFALQILQRQIEDIVVESDLSVVAVIGERMHKTPGVSGRTFGALGREGVNVVAISQGSSERNISVVVPKSQVAQAMRAIHKEFFENESEVIFTMHEGGLKEKEREVEAEDQMLHIYLIGTGLIGSTLLKQITELETTHIEVRGLANSKKMIVGGKIDLGRWRNVLAQGRTSELSRFVNDVIAAPEAHKVFVDCTASDETPHYYERLLSEGISIVTPNKKASSGSGALYKRLKQPSHTGVLHRETNVGAGLPVISTIRSLIETGDTILEIQGVFSGTLSYLFNAYDGTGSFAELVSQARDKGYTEPDPRDDLSGMDVARKLLILAREMGLEVEINDVDVENLTPESCREIQSVDEFLVRLSAHDGEYAGRCQHAKEQGKRLRYIGKIQGGKLRVSLETVGPEQPCYNLSGSDNLISIRTRRYSERPLVIQGPGAGAQVTAAGVFSDILQCLKEI